MTPTCDLVCRAHGGDVGALGQILNRYQGRVRKIVRRRMGRRVRRMHDSNDILQETFATAIRTFDRFEHRNEASVTNWLARIAEHAILGVYDWIVSPKRDQNRDVPLHLADGILVVCDDRPAPDEEAGRREESRILEECLDTLPARYREIIVLRNYQRLAWRAIALRHGRPSESAGRMMYAKAMRELDKCVRRRLADRTRN